jgi:hypothetical protein
MVAGASVRRRLRQPVSGPKTVQLSLTLEEFAVWMKPRTMCAGQTDHGTSGA